MVLLDLSIGGMFYPRASEHMYKQRPVCAISKLRCFNRDLVMADVCLTVVQACFRFARQKTEFSCNTCLIFEGLSKVSVEMIDSFPEFWFLVMSSS